jgi:hypothetical protein
VYKSFFRIYILELRFVWGCENLHIVYRQFTKLPNSSVPYCEQYYNTIMLVVWLIGKCLRKNIVCCWWTGNTDAGFECMSRYASETLSANFWTTRYLLTCLVCYINWERNKTHLTHGKILVKNKSKGLSFLKFIEINKK